MSRIHDERKDLYNREGVLTSSSNIRSNHTLSQSMDKEKIDKGSYQHPFDTGFRTIDLIKPSAKPPQGRSIVPASLGSTQLHAMPPLMPSFIHGSTHLINQVPINHGPLVRGSLSSGQHAFQTHIPVNIGTGIPPQRVGVTLSQRSSLPSLKPTNITNQIQLPLNQIPGLPTILPPAVGNRTGSPIVTTHGLTTDNHLDSHTTILSDPHHGLRGNVQAASQHAPQATIQVIASGTTVQQPSHIPTSFLSKGMTLSTTPNMLKIGITTHANSSSSTNIASSAFKLGIGKAYPGSSNVIIPSTSSSKSEQLQDGRSNSVPGLQYSRFSTAHNVTIPNHLIQSHPLMTTTTTAVNSSSTTITNVEPRSHAVGVPFHPAYMFNDMGHPIGIHGFPHQLIRPPSTSVGALPMFTIDSHPQRSISALPVVSIPVTSKGPLPPDTLNAVRSESLTIHGGSASFNISNIYPGHQPSSFLSSVNAIESSSRPSILRKRPAESSTLFPVKPTEKERKSSPPKNDNSPVNIIQTKMISSPALKSNEKVKDTTPISINHSILSITSDLKSEILKTKAGENANGMVDTGVAAQQALLTSAMTAAITANSILPEASPKKKPRKQLIITTEDKYGSTAPMNASVTDEDEEFLKANETMKDLTPPKSTTTATNPLPTTQTKQLFSPATVQASKPGPDAKHEFKDVLINGLISPVGDHKGADSAKYCVFRRRPQYSIINEYKVNAKAANNHYYRYSDIKVKDEKKSSQDRLLAKSSVDPVSGWRIKHISTQLDDMVSLEQEICQEMFRCKETIPPFPSSTSPTTNFTDYTSKLSGDELQLRLLHELLQGNIQRCRYSIEQLEETKQIMLKLLDYKPRALELLNNYKKSKLKKKST